jgi:hypothetical protein
MQELVNQLKEKVGISEEQAVKAVEAVKDFVKEKFPMMAGAVDNLLGEYVPARAPVADVIPAVSEESILDKISDVIPGEAGQKVEDFAKAAAHKAEDVFDAAKDKLSDMFGGDKK